MSMLKILIVSAFAASSLASAAPIDPTKYKEPVRVACIGDSITQGAGAAKGQVLTRPNSRKCSEISGKSATSASAAARCCNKGDFPYWNEKAYQNALAFKPDVVIIMLGTNDTKPQNWKHEAEFVADYRELVKSFLDLESKPRVFICRPCPVTGKGNFGINEAEDIQKEIPRIDALAAEMKLGVIDMHAALADKPELLPDRVHPNTEGAGEMAKAAFTALTGKKAREAVA